MTEEQHILEILALKQNEQEISPATLERIEAALLCYPCSPQLWCIRGDCIQLSSAANNYKLTEALASYQRALAINPTFARAHEGIGYYFDVVEIDLRRAEQSFTTAILHGGGPWSYHGLARVMAEMGREKNQILALLARCPEKNSKVILEIHEEIQRGTCDGVEHTQHHI